MQNHISNKAQDTQNHPRPSQVYIIYPEEYRAAMIERIIKLTKIENRKNS